MRIRTLVLATAVISSSGLQMRSQMSGPPTVTAGGYKGRPRESSGRFAVHDGIPGSGSGQGDAR